MDEWYKTRGAVGIILGLAFFIAGFVWLWYFFEYELFSPSDRFSIWLGAVIAGLLFFSGFCVSFKVQAKKSVMFTLMFLGYSLIFFVPVPSGYEEFYYGGFAVLLMAIVAFYAKYEESKKKKAQVGKETEKE